MYRKTPSRFGLQNTKVIHRDRVLFAMEGIETGAVQRRSMNKFKVFISTIFSTTFLLLIQVPCHAAETAFKEIVQDSLYGGFAGTVLGAAVMAFSRKPGDHMEYMAYGAAAGVLGGAAYGYFTSRALVEVDKGKVKFAIPTVMPDVKDSSRKSSLIVTTEFIKGNF